MFHYGRASNEKLAKAHPTLAMVFRLALEMSPIDISIVHSYRGKELQNQLVEDGASKTPWPKSRHNSSRDPEYAGMEVSDAIDFAPYIKGQGIPWNDTHLFCVVAGVVLAAANEMGVDLRWGGDWDRDGSTEDQTFMDWGHIELHW